ncbi:MAG: peptide chain release factor 1 [Myxococcota bacterium]
MFDRLEEMTSRYRELEELVGRPELASDPARLREATREMSALREAVETYARWERNRSALEESRELLADPDAGIQKLARAEITRLEVERDALEAQLRQLLVLRDPNDDKNVVIEIRAGTGGEEAALFASDLFRMYTRFAEERGWKIEILSLSTTPTGGTKEVIATISGRGAYRALKYESGVHRVQRVPVTESQGRIHTSTVTVAVLPEAAAIDVEIDEDRDLRVDVFRSSGPGGQSVNTTDSAVRITHIPTGLVVTCQDEKSQHKNRARALRILRSRLYDLEQRRQREERAQERRGQIGTGERSERIRTYNFPQNRVTDHRLGLTLHKLDRILEGDLSELIEQAALRMQGGGAS